MNEIVPKLEQLNVDFPEQVDAIRREVKSFEAAQKAVEDENRDLVIAIVGRVKSGKSSFLNALLFKGESVLPQAATPMTAALTFIRYDETCHAEVEFFSEGDWDKFKDKASNYEKMRLQVRDDLEKEEAEAERKAKRFLRKYTKREITDERINERLRSKLGEDTLAAVELVRMASENGGLNLAEYLGKKQRIDGSTPQELSEKLQDYVGARGRFTPIVCSTTIYLNDPGLKGYCVIDTPGTNDPVISRGKKTQDNLKKADVVLVMSPAGRFFDDSDLRLCSQNLPANGIKDFVILISQFDVSIGEIEDKIDHALSPDARMNEAMRKARADLIGRFRQCISDIARRAAANNNADQEKWDRLLKEEPILVSAKAFILSRHWDSLDDKEKEYLKKFNELIPGFTFAREDLQDFSMMSSVDKRLDRVKEGKEKILAERKNELAVASERHIAELVVEFRDHVKAQLEALEKTDLSKLEAELAAQTKQIEKGRMSLEDVFEEAIHTAHVKFNDILNEVREAKSRYSRLSVETETHQGTNYQQVMRGGFFGGIMDDLFGPKTICQYYTYTTRYADAYQAVEQVDAFASKARRMLEQGIGSAVDIKALQKRIVNVAFELLDGDNGQELDVDVLKSQIKRTVREVTIPDSDFGDVNYAELITSCFAGGRVEDDQIEILKSAQRDALQNVVTDLESRAKEKATAIEESLKRAMSTFVDKLIGDLRKNNEQLAASVKDKAAVCARWKSYLPILEGCLK